MHEFTTLLQQIADNTSTDNSVWVASVSGGAAVLGATVSAVITYFITNRTIRSQEKIEYKRLKVNVVTTERLRWLKDIRERVSDLYAQLDMQYAIIQQPIGNQTQQQIQSMLNQYSSQIMMQVNMITLMLNDKDKEQIDLRNELQKVLDFMRQCFLKTTSKAQAFNTQQYSVMKATVFNLSTTIGSETWKQISNLE